MDKAFEPGIQQAGDVEIKEIYFIDTKSNKKINLLGSMVDMTIYEDIFSPVLTGYCAIIETQNLISSLPIVGGEMLYIEFSTPSLNTIKTIFQITKIGIREHQDKKNAYTLDFISYEGYVDVQKRISKAYSGNTSELVKSVFSTEFGSQIVDADESDNFIKFVSPYWSPLKIINHITSRAILPNNKMVTPNYLFYQTCQGHKFKSLSTLLSAKAKTELFFDKNPARAQTTDGKSIRNIDREYKTIKELTFVASQDFLKNMMNGAYNHRLYGADILSKRFSLNTYSFTDDFNKTAHTDTNPLNILPISKNSGLHSIHHTYNNLFNGVKDISAEIIAKRISLLAQLETWKIDIVVHGRTDYEVGQTVYIWLNQFKTVDASDKYTNDTFDKIYSGKYLITAIQHRFTQAKHQINMQLIKDAAFSEIK